MKVEETHQENNQLDDQMFSTINIVDSVREGQFHCSKRPKKTTKRQP